MRLLVVSIIALAVLGACGKSRPRLATPGDGQTFTLGNGGFQYFDATLEDNDYQDVTIAVRGDLPPGEVLCSGGQGGPLRCQLAYQVNGSAPTVGTTCIPSCTIVIVAEKGEERDIRTVRFIRPTQ